MCTKTNVLEDNIDLYVVFFNNKKLLYDIITNIIPLSSFLGISDGSVYCPFHQDKLHKSAKIYDDVDGVSRLYCFGQCQTQYTSYDYVTKILRKEPNFYLFHNIPTPQIIDFVKNYKETNKVDTVKTQYVQEKYKESKGDLIKFIDLIYLED